MLNQIKDKLQDLGESLFKGFGERNYGSSPKSYIEQAYEQMAAFYKLCDLFPYESYDTSSQLFLNDETIGFVVETTPLVGSSVEMQKELSNLFQSVFPEESCIQFILWADPHIGDQCNVYRESRKGSGEILETMAEERAQYLKSLAFHSPYSPYSLRNFSVFISFNRPFNKNKTIIIEETIQILQQVKTTFETLGMCTDVWRPEDLISTLDGILHLDPSSADPKHWRWNPLQKSLINYLVVIRIF